jgi:hypothetical protein
MITIVLILTLVGSGTLLFITVKYYWGARGKPPLTGAEKRRQKEEELKLRAKQIEYARQNPIAPRKPGFLDNRKVVKNEKTK